MLGGSLNIDKPTICEISLHYILRNWFKIKAVRRSVPQTFVSHPVGIIFKAIDAPVFAAIRHGNIVRPVRPLGNLYFKITGVRIEGIN